MYVLYVRLNVYMYVCRDIILQLNSLLEKDSHALSERISQLVHEKYEREKVLSNMNHELRLAKDSQEKMTERVMFMEAAQRMRYCTATT